ncbi:hypothetical protein MMC13_002489 [Lambiella insularis]|nr:hypothetical protein [Lambiella insularis]
MAKMQAEINGVEDVDIEAQDRCRTDNCNHRGYPKCYACFAKSHLCTEQQWQRFRRKPSRTINARKRLRETIPTTTSDSTGELQAKSAALTMTPWLVLSDGSKLNARWPRPATQSEQPGHLEEAMEDLAQHIQAAEARIRDLKADIRTLQNAVGNLEAQAAAKEAAEEELAREQTRSERRKAERDGWRREAVEWRGKAEERM